MNNTPHDDSCSESGASRRDFIGGVCGLILAGVGVAAMEVPAEAAAGITRLADGRVKVTVAKVPALGKVGGAVSLGTVKGMPVALVRTGSSSYAALNLKCTHQGGPLKASSTGFTCQWHGAQFSQTGAVKRGPAQNALRRVKTTMSKGVLTVG